MEFNVGDLVHVQSFGKGIILDKKQDYKETATTIYFVRLIDRDKALWFCSDSLVFASKGEVKEIMAGILNNKIEKAAKEPYVNTKVVAPNKETGTFEPYSFNKSDDLYQKALEAAKKMSNSMYGIGHSISATVLRNDFNRFLNEVKDIKFSGPATIVFWKDGTKTVVKCQEGEHYDPKDGIEYALFKKIAGGTSNQASKMAKKYDEWLEKWIPEDLKSETVEQSENEESESHGSESTIMKATEETLDRVLNEDDDIYVAEEMKKRLIGMGKGIHDMADTMHSLNERLRGILDDKPEETEEK